jgi:hypothetical protein
VDFFVIDDNVAGRGDAEADLVNEFSEKSRCGLFHWVERACDPWSAGLPDLYRTRSDSSHR